MPKYEMYGVKVQAVCMTVEADNLEEAIKKCQDGRYDIDYIDPSTSISVDDKLIENENGDIILEEIPQKMWKDY